MMENLEKPYYGYKINTYVSAASIGSGIVSITLAIIFTILAYSTWVLILCWALGAILLIFGMFWHLTLGWVNNSEKIELLQQNFLDQLGTIWDGKGKVLDIGTGSGQAAIRTAKRFPEAQVVGIDTWTKFWSLWGHTKANAEKNATIENVGDRCTFQNDNALDLLFKDGEFQLVVSAFTFHEIHIPDRTVLFKEFIRVLAPGGAFVICDVFPKGYGVKSIPELLKKLQQLGVEDVKYKNLEEAGLNFGALSHIIWRGAYLSGRKT